MGEEEELGNVEMKVGLVNTAIWSCVRVHLRVAGFPDRFVPMMSGDIGTSGKKRKPSLKSWVNHRFVVYIRYKLEYLGNTPPTSCHNWPRRRRRARKIPQHSNWSRANPWYFRCFICQVYQKNALAVHKPTYPPYWINHTGSYSTAITHLNMESFSLDRSLNRLLQVQDELVDHLASIKHEYHLIKQ